MAIINGPALRLVWLRNRHLDMSFEYKMYKYDGFGNYHPKANVISPFDWYSATRMTQRSNERSSGADVNLRARARRERRIA